MMIEAMAIVGAFYVFGKIAYLAGLFSFFK